MKPTLLLGGTTEASLLARTLASRGIPAVFSYAGRVDAPKAQPLPTRTGGFGGAEGLAEWLVHHDIGQVTDATHPFAAQMSRNAAAACARLGLPWCRLERAPWRAQQGDLWHEVASIEAAHDALQGLARRVFLAIGRQHLAQFRDLPQHDYLLRLVDQPDALPLPKAQVVVSRGPFTVEGDLELLRAHRTEVVLCKNAGGEAARSKLTAARELGLPVIMIARPAKPDGPVFRGAGEVMEWLHARLGV